MAEEGDEHEHGIVGSMRCDRGTQGSGALGPQCTEQSHCGDRSRGDPAGDPRVLQKIEMVKSEYRRGDQG